MKIENPFGNPSQETSKTETERQWSKEQIHNGVEFARSLVARGYLSSGEVGAVIAAHNLLKEGQSSEIENSLLTEWADKAERAKAQEQNDAKLRQFVVQELGEETLAGAESSGHDIDASIKKHLLEIKEQNPTDIERATNLWQEFSNNLFIRLNSGNLLDSKKVEDALKLANALLQAEPTQEGEYDVKKGIEALRKRYGI